MFLPLRSHSAGSTIALATAALLTASNQTIAQSSRPGARPATTHARPVVPQPIVPRPVVSQPVVSQPVVRQPVIVNRTSPLPAVSPSLRMTTTRPPASQTTSPVTSPTVRSPVVAFPGLIYAGLGYGLGYASSSYPGIGGYPGLGYPGTGMGGNSYLNSLFNMLPGQAGNAQQTPGLDPTGRFFTYTNVTGAGMLSGALPIVSQFAGIGGQRYGGFGGEGGYGGQYQPNLNLLPPGVAVNVAYNTLPGIPMTQAQPINGGFGSPFGLFGNPFGGFGNPYGGFGNPVGFGNPFGGVAGFGIPIGGFPGKVGFGNGGYGL